MTMETFSQQDMDDAIKKRLAKAQRHHDREMCEALDQIQALREERDRLLAERTRPAPSIAPAWLRRILERDHWWRLR